MKNDKPIVIHVFKYLTIGLYLVALPLPAFEGYEGYMVLFLGALAFFVTNIFGSLAWLANVLLVCSFWRGISKKSKLILSFIAVALGLLTFFVDDIMLTEGGDRGELTIGIGYYFWLASLIANLIMRSLDYFIINKQIGKV